jgi:hypothetical protein
MYQRSRKMLIFLVAIFLGITIACVGITATGTSHTIGGKLESWIKDISASDLLKKYQRSSFSLALINAIMTTREMLECSIP